MPDDTTPDDTSPDDTLSDDTAADATPPDDGTGLPRWDPQQLLRDRAAATRTTRDQTIAELRASMDDEETLDEFGINLSEIER